MRRLWQFVLCCGVLWATLAAGAAAAAPRDVLAHASGDTLWVAQVAPRPADVGPLGQPVPGPAEQTQVWARQSKPNQHWHVLAVVPGRVTSLATRESQLAVLTADGQWLTVYADGMATGQPLPAGGRLRALADDGHTLWAVGQVNGGLARAAAALAAQAAATRSTDDSPLVTPATAPAATRPATGPVVDVVMAVTATDADRVPRLVLFKQDQGHWAAVAELPPDVPVASADELSVAVVGHAPIVAYRVADGSVRVERLTAGRWAAAGQVRPADAGGRPVAFELLDAAAGPALWLTVGPADPGQVRALPAAGDPAAAAEDAPHKLTWAGPPPLAGVPAAAVAGGYLRLVGPAAGGRVFEQRYALDAAQPGAAVGTPAEVYVPADADSTLLSWVQGLLLASLTFTVGTSVYRQVTPAAAAPAGGSAAASEAPPVVTPAPLSTRAAAGAIDLLPLAMAVLAALITIARHPEDPAHLPALWLVLVGAGVYLAHTTALETLTARTAGKWVMGLRVVTPDGGRPAPWQLLTRNLLRVLDPLVRIPVSALRQRTADVLANTVVVRAADPTAAPNPSEPQA